MGRHAADDGAGVHPIVAAALQRRQAPAQAGACAETSGDVGWPGDPADGTGLGWPADTQPSTRADDAAAAESTPVESALHQGPPIRRRLGWRRLFGGGSTGQDARGGISAA